MIAVVCAPLFDARMAHPLALISRNPLRNLGEALASALALHDRVLEQAARAAFAKTMRGPSPLETDLPELTFQPLEVLSAGRANRMPSFAWIEESG
jgi:hypothetical protein